ncbi:hypothetical protein FA15DRAFT_586579 [Coprinopsis marcescibilis]|uniref:Uncharacterized protein n=1 Tax=Coprinopsis marcescibilis TaxID=230819 RepID=A0A5C3L3Y4_COPMA|nr:hypothetical protein FA15DRAFT_586579 [Coprinopsis marcescibilis]
MTNADGPLKISSGTLRDDQPNPGDPGKNEGKEDGIEAGTEGSPLRDDQPNPGGTGKGEGQEGGTEVRTQGPDRAKPKSISREKSKARIRKLTPARPFPLVPTSVSATGPRSAHNEGKNFICITRRTKLGQYMRRCKAIILDDGYKTLHLSAMGAAIPLLLQLSCALPHILPYPNDEIKTDVTTGSCEVQDEVLPEDGDEDISIQSRLKSTLQIVVTIGDGKFEGDTSGPARRTKTKNYPLNVSKSSSKGAQSKSRHIPEPGVFLEPEQEDELLETV